MSSNASRQIAELAATVAGLLTRIECLEAARPRDDADAALQAELEALKARVSRLEGSARAPRDREDAELRRLLPASTRAFPFKASELLQHTAEDGELRRALVAASVLTTAEVGAWLRDHQGTRDGVTITRLRRRQWQATYTSYTLTRDVSE